jgi:hypothetical protein
MSVAERPPELLEEIADLVASCPDRDRLLSFRPSAAVQTRARDLLEKLNAGRISEKEQHELDRFEQAELLMRLVKARVRSAGSS